VFAQDPVIWRQQSDLSSTLHSWSMAGWPTGSSNMRVLISIARPAGFGCAGERSGKVRWTNGRSPT